MILKNKSFKTTSTPQAIAGQKQEQDVAFYLRRAFKDHPGVLVINDLKFTFNDETAQIDHLIVYTYGLVIIESKSIKGHVKVNSQGEWTRSYNNQWSGMASPIKQVELQQALLKELLNYHRSAILGKLLGIKQQGFSMRCWDHLCVVSSSAVIDRQTMPNEISVKLVKTEFLVDKLSEIMNLQTKFKRFINIKDTRSDFTPQELESVGQFILEQHIEAYGQTVEPTITTPIIDAPNDMVSNRGELVEAKELQAEIIPSTINEPSEAIASPIVRSLLSCKHCGELSNFTPRYGKFGYFINCIQCTKNTPMKQPCPECQSKEIKISKSKETYTLSCTGCGFAAPIING